MRCQPISTSCEKGFYESYVDVHSEHMADCKQRELSDVRDLNEIRDKNDTEYWRKLLYWFS